MPKAEPSKRRDWDSNPGGPKTDGLASRSNSHSGTPPGVVAGTGFEPVAFGL